ncbi:MAG: hypothetical protein EOP84_08990 [Verrucomicrobiaceae bacterium]|nr:MAG: hypothetical protein EOP84_08990 [Verrucomicrobiaceae bacterium]
MFLKTLKTQLSTLSAVALATAGASLDQTQAAVFGPGTVHSVTLAWDAVPEANVAGYKVHVGTQPGQYTQVYDAGTNLSYSVAGLDYGTTYYISVQTVTETGDQSGYAPDLKLTVSLPPLPPTTGMAATASGPGGLQWSYPKTALDSYPDFIIESSTDLLNWSPAGTVSSDASTSGTATHANYTFAITKNGPQRFYRLSARNWLGDSSAP